MKKALVHILNYGSFLSILFMLTTLFIDISSNIIKVSPSLQQHHLYEIGLIYFIIDSFIRFILNIQQSKLFSLRHLDILLIICFIPSIEIFLINYSLFPIPLILVILGRLPHLDQAFKFLNFSPAQLFILGFIYITFLGMLLLSLPISLNQPVSLIDLFFTATSAVCVTGLLTVDIAKTFSPFGQSILLILIQLGGIGVMTFYGLFALIAHRKLSQKEQVVYQDSLLAESSHEFVGLIRSIIVVTLIVETVGFLAILAGLNFSGLSLKTAVFPALFLAVSSFCNAGISNLSNGLYPYTQDAQILIPIAILIIIGGIGFPVIFDVVRVVKKNLSWHYLKAQTKLCLLMSVLLIVIGTLALYGFESQRAFIAYSESSKWLNAFFHAVSSRTAGFATQPLIFFHPTSLVMIIILMFIGTSPGSTGGGVKTSSFALLLSTMWQVIRGRSHIVLFGRTIPKDNILRLISLIAAALIIIFLTLMALLYVEKQTFLPIVFECVSAFATVGFSLESTEKLSQAGKIILIVAMFLGRLGPLTIAFAFSQKKQKPNYQYPEERILIG